MTGTPPPVGLPASRRNQRRDMISMLVGLNPGDELSWEDVYAATGLVWSQAGDRAVIYGAREHSRDVNHVLTELKKDNSGLWRPWDHDIATRTGDRRRDRVYRQAMRGVSEQMAIADFSAMPATAQRRSLANQSILGTAALATSWDAAKMVEDKITAQVKLAPLDPATIVELARKVNQ